MNFKRIYELWSLCVGLASILILSFYMIMHWGSCFFLTESNIYIRGTEIICYISVLPYYAKRLWLK